MTELDLEKFKLVNGEDIYKIKDSGAVRIAQGAENANKYMVTDAQGNVIPKIIPPVTVKKLYGIRIFKGKEATSGHGVLEMYSSDVADNVSTIASRLALMQQYMRHVVVRNDSGTLDVKQLDETDISKYPDGTTAPIDGTGGYDVMLEIDTLYWKSYDCGDYWDIKFGTWVFDDDVESSHKFNGTYRKHLYFGFFNSSVDGDGKLRSYNTSELPANGYNIDQCYNMAHSGGDTYVISNTPHNNLLILLHLFVYGTKNIQTIAKGLNMRTGGSAPVERMGAVNMDFDPTKAWTNGTLEDLAHCCTTLGIMNFYGKQSRMAGDTIANNTGGIKFATDAADHHSVTDITYATAPTTWKEVTGLLQDTEYHEYYIKEICGKSVLPFAGVEEGANSSTYYCDTYVVQSSSESGQTNLIVGYGGAVTEGYYADGLFSRDVFYLTYSNMKFKGARLVIYSTD